MRITKVEAFAVRISRDLDAATGTAGSPTPLSNAEGNYRWSRVYPVLYSTHIETALVRVLTDCGLVGWGEAQAPLAPEVVCAIIHHLLKPALEGCEFQGTREAIEALWSRMYSMMRVRGQTGGFMLDAISGIDLALWDLAGQVSEKPVCELIAGIAAKPEIPAYVSGLSGWADGAKLERASEWVLKGHETFKIFYDSSSAELLGRLDILRRGLPSKVKIAVDALWRLTPDTALEFGRRMDEREVFWLECPLMPENVHAHAELAKRIRTPVALGESYRTRYELAPFFEQNAIAIVQPDLGRCGITEAIRIASAAAERGLPIVPHASIALGPQLAAAVHLAAALPNCHLLEFNPVVLDVANRFLGEPILVRNGSYVVPQSPGLGAAIAVMPQSSS